MDNKSLQDKIKDSYAVKDILPQDNVISNITTNLIKIMTLVDSLNMYRDAYYNDNNSLISDKEYDELFDELVVLEQETGIVLSNSPTQTVGYKVISAFEKVSHTNPLLSLDKTQDIDEFIKFCSQNEVLIMHKLDGLTVKLEYKDGKLFRASTRGDGLIGEDITHNAECFENIPLSIPNTDDITVIGEAIITRDDFSKINATLSDSDKYKNPRNLVSGSVRQLDSHICKQRHVKFICWNADSLSLDGTMESGLIESSHCGFTIVNNIKFNIIANSTDVINSIVTELRTLADAKNIPIDGLVGIYNNIEYGKSLGRTSHHFNNGFAYKFYDEDTRTTLKDIEWSIGKTGELTPVAVFDPVEIDGTIVERASLHNVSILQSLELGIGDDISVYKANMIIPQIRTNYTKSNNITIPDTCPVCNYKTKLNVSLSGPKNNIKEVKTLFCTNPNCKGKLLKIISHYVSKPAMDIQGLSEVTISKLIDLNILTCIPDIYTIKDHTSVLMSLEGFGQLSVNNLISAIEKSKKVSLDKFINALSIPSIGSNTAKVLAKICNNNPNNLFELATKDLTHINGFGEEIQSDIHSWFSNIANIALLNKLIDILSFSTVQSDINFNTLYNKNFVITGKLQHFANRAALVAVIETHGGTIQSSVSSTTSYLINNDIDSQSSKNKKAKSLNIPIITENEFMQMINMSADNNAVTSTQPVVSESPVSTIKKGSKKKLF